MQRNLTIENSYFSEIGYKDINFVTISPLNTNYVDPIMMNIGTQ